MKQEPTTPRKTICPSCARRDGMKQKEDNPGVPEQGICFVCCRYKPVLPMHHFEGVK